MPDHNNKYNVCLVSEEQAGHEGEWYEFGDLEKVRLKFASFEHTVRKLLNMAKPEDCYIWRLSEMPPLKNWASEGGKVVAIGDAVHAMLPYTGMVCAPLNCPYLRWLTN